MFEPAYGSAVDIARKGIANPIAMILPMGMMIDWLGFSKDRLVLEEAMFSAIRKDTKTPDMGGGAKTAAFTEQIISELLNNS